MADVIGFADTLKPRRVPLPKTQTDNLKEISAPEVIEGNIMCTMVAAYTLGLKTFGPEKTIEIATRALKTARMEARS